MTSFCNTYADQIANIISSIQSISITDKETVTKWGNSQGIRIPKEILDKMDIHINSVVTVDCIDGSCIIIKREEPSTLEELFSDFYGKPFNQLTGKELQCDTDEWNTGKPVGGEIW